MNTKTILFLALAVAGSLAPTVRAQHIDVGIDIRLGRALPPPPPEVIVTEQVGPPGPPPWAAEHRWYRHTYNYYFYPECDVYYCPDTRMWFYLDGRTWRAAARLPDFIRIDFGRSVSLRLDGDRPYLFHDRVVAYYPRNYFAKVRFKSDRDERRDDHRDDRGRDDRDRDHR
jgi:hypothetical protein